MLFRSKVINIGSWNPNGGFGLISQIDYQEAFAVYLTTRNAILASSVTVGLLLTILITSLINSRQFALQLVKKRTTQLNLQNEALLEEIDERKKIEQTLQSNQQTTTAILQSAFDAIIATDKNGNIQLVNPATEAMFGYTESELLNKNIKILMPESIINKHDDFIHNYHQGKTSNLVGHRREMEARRKDGTTFPIELALEETIINDEMHFTSTINDITVQKNMMERISASEKEYKSIINNLSDTFYRTDIDGNMVMVSPSVEQLLGYRMEELIKFKLANLYVDPQGREKLRQSLQKNNGSVIDYEIQMQRKDGIVIWIATNAHTYYDEIGRAHV